MRSDRTLRAAAARTSASLLAHYDRTVTAHPAAAAGLAPLRSAVQQHAKALSAGAKPAGPSDPVKQPGPAPAPADAQAALKELASEERRVAGLHAKSLLDAEPELARLLASIAAAERRTRTCWPNWRRRPRHEQAGLVGADGHAGRARRRARGGLRVRVLGGRLTGRRRTEATAAYEAHRARRDALVRTVRDLGGTPVAADAAYALPFAVRDPAGAERLAAVLEDRVAGVYSDVVRAARGLCETGRGRSAGGRRTRGPLAGSGVAFPGLAEKTTEAQPDGGGSRRGRPGTLSGVPKRL
ncbi:ferritin-like domain-containing protein [Streptomyces sp. M10(2022)]